MAPSTSDRSSRIARTERLVVRRPLTPLADFLLRVGVTPTQVNFAGFIGSLAAAGLLFADELLAAGVIFFFASTLDAVDGTLARKLGTDKSFSLGAWLDAFLGFAAELTMYFALALSEPSRVAPSLVTAIVVSVALVSYAKAVAGEYEIRPDWQDARAVGRGLRILILSAGLVVAGIAQQASLPLGITLWVLLGANTATLTYRTIRIVQASKDRDAVRAELTSRRDVNGL